MQNSKNLYTAHRQWASRPADQRFETLESLSSTVKARRMKSRAVDVDVAKITAEVTNVTEAGDSTVGSPGTIETVTFNRGLSAVEPTHWSFGQMASWIKAPADYLRRLPTELAVRNINHGLANFQSPSGNGNQLKFMAISREDSDVNILQAVTSTRYGRIWDADVCDCVERIRERTGGRFYNPKAMVNGALRPSGLYSSDHDVFIFMVDGGSQGEGTNPAPSANLIDAGPRAQLFRGFIMSNSETGAATCELTTFYFNVVCANHIIWGVSDVHEISIRHNSGAPTRFDVEAGPALRAYVEAPEAPVKAIIQKAQGYLLTEGKKDNEVETWLRAKGFTRDESREAVVVAKAEEGECRTLWQAVQGLTAYARTYEFVDARVDLETRAGKLLDIVKTN